MTAAATIDPSPTVGPSNRRLRRGTGPLIVSGVLATWVVAVGATGAIGRVADNVHAAITMVFGSFVAGSTPQGGGAVAFPVLTKAFGVTANDARTFSLSIQAVGMGTAALVLLATGARVDVRALRFAVPAALSGFFAGAAVFGMMGPPGAYVKVAFTLLIALTGITTWRRRHHTAAADRRRVSQVVPTLVAAAFAGGVVSSLVGSGADVAVYLVLTIAVGLGPRAGVATSVVTMAAVSIAGLVVFGIAGGGLTAPTAAGTDLYGMWLAAVPIVAMGAPLGSWAAQRVQAIWLVGFISALATVEVVTTAVFVDELRTDVRLRVFAVLGLAAVFVAATVVAPSRRSPDASGAALAPPDPSTRHHGTPIRTGGPLVGVSSAVGVVNPPGARFCRRSGLRLAGAGARGVTDDRPPLAVVVLDDGSSFSVERDVVIGRDPALPGPEDAAIARVVDDDRSSVSRRHLLLRTQGWDVEAVDLGTVNGSFVRADDGEWQRLHPGIGRILPTDTELRVGGRTMKFHLVGR